jgi:hypothetical protein
MKTKIIAGLNEQDASEMRASFDACAKVRERLIELLDQEINTIQRDMVKGDHLLNPNWTMVQLDRIAQIKSHEKLKELLS